MPSASPLGICTCPHSSADEAYIEFDGTTREKVSGPEVILVNGIGIMINPSATVRKSLLTGRFQGLFSPIVHWVGVRLFAQSKQENTIKVRSA